MYSIVEQGDNIITTVSPHNIDIHEDPHKLTGSYHIKHLICHGKEGNNLKRITIFYITCVLDNKHIKGDVFNTEEYMCLMYLFNEKLTNWTEYDFKIQNKLGHSEPKRRGQLNYIIDKYNAVAVGAWRTWIGRTTSLNY